MQAEHNWAPPTIGDVRLPDRDLGRRLSRQPDVEMRAKMLGLDWTTLAAARTRLRAGSWLISAAAASAAILSDLSLPASRHGSPMLTLVVVAIAVWACMLGLRSVSGFPLLIARNDPSTAARYRSLATLSPTQSLLGYRVRWILVRHAITVSVSVTLVTLMARGW
ncbi:MAG: hypothetical protein QOH69_312 [Actinomycetota bacterium]|jgi:hypothetical protein|nr:hypothetical protein [Actinomycetota bacterium]